MDTAATLALLLDRGVDEAGGWPDHETTSAILDEASRFGEAGWREMALPVNRCGHDFDAAFDAV
jgi:hypothetical protein